MIIEIKNDNGGMIKKVEVQHIGMVNDLYTKYRLPTGDTILHNYSKGEIELAIRVLKIMKKAKK